MSLLLGVSNMGIPVRAEEPVQSTEILSEEVEDTNTNSTETESDDMVETVSKDNQNTEITTQEQIEDDVADIEQTSKDESGRKIQENATITINGECSEESTAGEDIDNDALYEDYLTTYSNESQHLVYQN